MKGGILLLIGGAIAASLLKSKKPSKGGPVTSPQLGEPITIQPGKVTPIPSVKVGPRKGLREEEGEGWR